MENSMRSTIVKLTRLAVLAAIEEKQLRTFAGVVFVLYLGLAGTALAEGVAGTGLSRSTFRSHHHHHHHHHYARSFY
jgi:hypothetical protein